MKNQKGITLIALVITIIVMLILVAVSVTVALNGGLFTTAKNAAEGTEREVKAEQKLADGKIKIGDNWYASYQDYKDGKILEPGIILEESLKIEIPEEYDAENSPITKELTATLNEIEGNVIWEVDNEEVAIIVEEGTKVTVTAVAAGTAKLTATCEYEGETYTAECEIKVKVPVPLAIGSFVQYDVEYTDAYEEYEYTKNNGWRLLDYTKNGDGTYSNVKLISTGIPARLYYYSIDKTNSSWYVTKETNGEGETEIETLANFRNILTNGGADSYTFYTTASTYYALQAAAGLYYNFGDIKFAYGTSNRGYNLGYFTKIKSNGTTYGKTGEIDETTNEEIINGAEKRGAELFIPAGINATVRLITLPEMNKMLGRTDIDGTGSTSDPMGAPGLFNLKNLTSVISGYSYGSGHYWLASPYPNTSHGVCRVGYGGGVSYDNYGDYGVRSVVCLNSNVQIVESETEGVFEIK